MCFLINGSGKTGLISFFFNTHILTFTDDILVTSVDCFMHFYLTSPLTFVSMLVLSP